jgi:hypothetical protein
VFGAAGDHGARGGDSVADHESAGDTLMALSITSITRKNGASCNHVTVVVDDEGVSRTFHASFQEIDDLLAEQTVVEQKKMLVFLWAKYRRAMGRTVLGVEVA